MKTFKQLLARLDEVSGVPFGELAPAVGVTWNPGGPAHNKGFAARVVQRAMGMAADDNRPEPDLTDLGVEVKSIPIGADLKVLENTKICSLNFTDARYSKWKYSKVYEKLRNILFVPVVKYDKQSWNQWYIRAPFIWMPSLRADEIMAAEFQKVQDLLKSKRYDEISAKLPPKGPCKVLIPNTAGADGNAISRYVDEDGEEEVKQRAWWLRKTFTQQIIDENLGLQSAGWASQPPAE